MDIERKVTEVLHDMEADGTINQMVEGAIKKGVSDVLVDMFGYGSEIKKAIEKQLEAAYIPVIETKNWSDYIPKLDAVLTELLGMKNVVDYRKVVENFRELAQEVPTIGKSVSLEDIFKKYKKFAADEVDTSELEVIVEDRPSYQYIDVQVSFEETDRKSWWDSNIEYGILHFTCDQDENLNRDVELRNNGNHWVVNDRFDCDFRSLRTMDVFAMFIMRLRQEWTAIEADPGDSLGDSIEPTDEPEATFS